MNVLVAFATRHGATRGIAERIGARLELAGLEAEVLSVDEVGDVGGYDAFVIGGAAYMTRWLKEASGFVRRHESVLATRPVWLFSSGPTGVEATEDKRRAVLKASEPHEFAELQAAIHPRGTRVFYGAYDVDAPPIGVAEGFLARLTRVIPAVKEGIPSGDFRDWPEIEAWADEIAGELQGRPLATLAPA